MADLIKQAVLNKARKDKFLLVLDLPPILKKLNASGVRSSKLLSLDSIQFSVFGINLPGSEIKAHDIGIYGQTYKVTSQARTPYPEVTVDFTVDNNYDNYWILWKWLAILNDPKEGGMDGTLAEYLSYTTSTKFGSPSEHNKDTPSGIKYKHKELRMQNFFTDYQTTITLFPMREYNEMIAKFKYTNAFITKLNDIKFSNRDTGEAECGFSFSFNQLHMELLEPNSDKPV